MVEEPPPESRVSSKLDFCEIVEVGDSSWARRHSIAGQTGAVVGIAEPDSSGGPITYAVQLIDGNEVWSIDEDELITTGRFASRDRFDSGQSIRVNQEGEVLE